MLYTIMRVISGIFHPLLMATYSCLILYWIYPEIFSPIPPGAILYFIIAVFVLTFLIPVVGIMFLRFTRRISNLEVSQREERILPFFFIAILYSITTYMLHTKMVLSTSILVMMMTVSFLVTIIFLISIWYKISVHSAGVWGTTGIFTAYSIKYLDQNGILLLAILFLFSGITTSSRLYLGVHTPAESWSGVIIGFVVCFTGVFFFS